MKKNIISNKKIERLLKKFNISSDVKGTGEMVSIRSENDRLFFALGNKGHSLFNRNINYGSCGLYHCSTCGGPSYTMYHKYIVNRNIFLNL
jgi:hypothetical protein